MNIIVLKDLIIVEQYSKPTENIFEVITISSKINKNLLLKSNISTNLKENSHINKTLNLKSIIELENHNA